MATRLIINADDFGFSPGMSDGIIEAHQSGILTSTTLMSNMPDADRAITLADENPNLGVGIHLCLTQGHPLANTLTALVDSRGNFYRRLPRLLARSSLSRRIRHEVEIEWSAQIEFAINRGLTPTHLDSHKHIHHWPPLGEIAVKLAQKYAIKHIRCAREIALPCHGESMGFSYRLLAKLADRLHDQIIAHDLVTTDWFFGLKATGRMSTPTWMRLFDHLPAGTGEVMVHPGDPSGLTRADTRLVSERILELTALCDPGLKKAIRSLPIALIHYGTL